MVQLLIVPVLSDVRMALLVAADDLAGNGEVLDRAAIRGEQRRSPRLIFAVEVCDAVARTVQLAAKFAFTGVQSRWLRSMFCVRTPLMVLSVSTASANHFSFAAVPIW